MVDGVRSIAVAAGAAIFSALYYMDWRRRSEPDYKEKRRELLEHRPVQKMMKLFDMKTSDVPEDSGEEFRLPRNPTQEEVAAFLYKLIELAEAAFLVDETEAGARHLATAFVLSGEDRPLVEMMRQELPGDAFRQTMRQMPAARAAVEKMLYEGPTRH